MKKLFTVLFCLLGMMASAEQMKMALLQPRVAEGSDACRPIELNMVRGELRKAFGWQSEFQVLTRTDVDQMLKELGFQQSGMVDDNQRKKVGEMTGAQYICVSTITKDGTQLYIESYLVNVETGQMTNPATQYANVENNNYGTLQEPCNELAREMLGELGGSSAKQSNTVHNHPVHTTPTTPNNTIPENKVTTNTSDNQSSNVSEDYVDLGLPSGTLWKSSNENCGLIIYQEAMTRYGNSLPTKEQWEELVRSCSWAWTGNGYTVTGSNNKSIFLSAEGLIFNNRKTYMGKQGYYWSSTQTDTSSMSKAARQKIAVAGGLIWALNFQKNGKGVGDRTMGVWSCSVRLVK